MVFPFFPILCHRKVLSFAFIRWGFGRPYPDRWRCLKRWQRSWRLSMREGLNESKAKRKEISVSNSEITKEIVSFIGGHGLHGEKLQWRNTHRDEGTWHSLFCAKILQMTFSKKHAMWDRQIHSGEWLETVSNIVLQGAGVDWTHCRRCWSGIKRVEQRKGQIGLWRSICSGRKWCQWCPWWPMPNPTFLKMLTRQPIMCNAAGTSYNI